MLTARFSCLLAILAIVSDVVMSVSTSPARVYDTNTKEAIPAPPTVDTTADSTQCEHLSKIKLRQRVVVLCERKAGDTTLLTGRDRKGHLVVSAIYVRIPPGRLLHVADSVHEELDKTYGDGHDCQDESVAPGAFFRFERWDEPNGTVMLRVVSLGEAPTSDPRVWSEVATEWLEGKAGCGRWVDEPARF